MSDVDGLADAALADAGSDASASSRATRETGSTILAVARGRSRGASTTSDTTPSGTPRHASRAPSSSPVAVNELIAQLQRVWQRQRIRADERAFARDIDKIVRQLRRADEANTSDARAESATLSTPGPSSASGSETSSVLSVLAARYSQLHHFGDTSSESGTDSTTSTLASHPSSTPRTPHQRPADANVEALLGAMDALFRHRYQEVRALAFEVVNLCIRNYGEQLTSATRRRIFQQLEDHDASGDAEHLQKTLRLLTLDGRRVEPFQVELGWLLLQWLEESDEQRDLLNLIQQVLRRSPLMLDFETVIAITSVVCGRCDVAWSRGDVETCKRFLSFFHVLATHRLEHALGTSVCLRTLCWMVNADGQGTWSVMKHLFNSSAGFQVLRGLVTLLESPTQYNQWILRGAVFFVGMSCWGSQRVARLDEIKWAPILMAMETCLQTKSGVVVFEIILAIQRLVKKYGDCKPSTAKESDVSANAKKTAPPTRRLVVEWDIILRMFLKLREWLPEQEVMPSRAEVRQGSDGQRVVVKHLKTPSIKSSSSQKQADIPVHMTRIPKELLDTLQVVVDLVDKGKFSGEVEEFYEVLEEYFDFLPESAIRLMLRHRAEAAHPAHHIDWLHTLEGTMETFFMDRRVPASVREETLELLQVNLWSSRNVCEDRVVEEVLLPMLTEVYDDPEPNIRRKALDLIIEVARTLESVRFDSLLDILENAVQLSKHEDAQLSAIAGIVSLFSSYFNHLPQSRALRMYDVITTVVESHQNWEVRQCALRCLLHVCEASSDFRLQWKDTKTRTSRFLFCSRRAVRNQQTGAFVPVQHGLRALLTLISKETHANLFRMAVEGLRRMLYNRVILADIDISDTAMKIISCIDYEAFGRAAIPDELKVILSELEKELKPQEASSHHAVEREQEPLTTGGSSQRATRNNASVRVNLLEVKSNFREAAALLCKIRFTTMGLQLLELFVSYIGELNARARHHLMICVVGAIDTQLLISEHDFLTTSGEEQDSSSTHSASAWIWPSRVRSNSSQRGSSVTGSVDEAPSQAAAQASGIGPASYADVKPVSPQVAFTSRVLSKLQSSAHPSSLFNALTASSHGGRDRRSTSSDSATTAAARQEKELLLRCLRLVFDAEFALLHTATNSISLLGHVVPDVVSARLDMLLRSATSCFFTPDGSFRCDGYAAVLEMVGNLVVGTPTVAMRVQQKSRVIEDLVMVAFRRHIDKATTYLAYRILCETIFRCDEKEHRTSLASRALPLLKESISSAITSHTLTLAEAAIDFLMCFALSRSDHVVAPALRIVNPESKDQYGDNKQADNTRRTWVYHNTIVTIETQANRPSILTVRRASSTSRWHLAMRQDFVSDPSEGAIVNSRTDGARQIPSLTQDTSAEVVATEAERSVREDEVAGHLPPQVPRLPAQSRAVKNLIAADSNRRKTKAAAVRLTPTPTQKRPEFPHLPIPPLPAYDGIGGSPSFFCEPAPTESDGSAVAMEHMLLNDPAQESAEPAHEDTSSPGEGDLPENGDALEAAAVISTADTQEGGLPQPDSGEDLIGTPLDAHQEVAPSTNEHDDSKPSTPKNRTVDPVFLMMQLFDLGVEDRPQLLVNGPSLGLGLNVLDRTPEFETHKVGVLYLRNSKRKAEVEILGSFGGSLRYLQFLRALGTVTQLEGLRGYTGGMDTSNGHNDGKCMLLYRSHALQIVFHVATMMNSHAEIEKEMNPPADATTRNDRKTSPTTMKKKRHIGNDFVHIVFKECDEEYDVQTFSGQFNDVHIIVQPLNDLECRTQVKCKPGIAPFGPLYGTQVIPTAIAAACVRQTALNANLACHAFHQEQLGFTMNCEERLKQIKQLGTRYATTSDEWTLDAPGDQPRRS